MVKGSIDAYRAQAYVKTKGMAGFTPVRNITRLAGPAFFAEAGDGIKQAIASF